MEKFLIMMAIVGTIVFAYLFVICLAEKWLGKSAKTALYLLPLLALCMLFTSCGSDPSDHTGENWLMLIGLILCWLKG